MDKVTTRTLKRLKSEGVKITAITAYDTPTARLADAAGIDIILIGDSVGNTVLGYETTVPVTLEEMHHHLKAVRRGVQRALLVVDMPFLSYGVSVEEAVLNAGTLMKVGAEAVKLEGATPLILESIRAMVGIGIPVMAHLGMTPQSVHQFGGFVVQGRSEKGAEALVEAAKAVEAAGAFSLVLELVPAQAADSITCSVNIPTIGIGAGVSCDGQIQVLHDVIGLSEQVFRHAKRYTDTGEQIRVALEQYAQEVRDGTFPAEENSF
jgi:3-methyl-2-oxobutanoate hydroxymethyltransferase